MFPDAGLVMIPEAGHLPWLDFPELTADRAREFLGHPRNASAGKSDQTTEARR